MDWSQLLKFDNINQINHKLHTPKTFFIVIVSIILITVLFYQLDNTIAFSSKQKRADASGFTHHYGQHFFYFQYYLNLFPIAISDPIDFSKKGAEKLLSEKGSEAIMEYKHWTRLGENTRIYAYYPSAIFKRSAKKPSLKGFNSIVFAISLILLFSGFYRIKKPFLGILLITLVFVTPYFQYEVFERENIFALLASTFFIVLGLNMPFIYLKSRSYLLIISALLSGLIIGFFSEMRAEIKVVIISVFIMYSLALELKIIWRILAITIALFAFISTKSYLQNHFEKKFEQARTIVAKQGGHVYTGPRISGHRFWHPVFCGLGDYGQDKGYVWNDSIAYAYATPILAKEYNIKLSYTGGYKIDEYYDNNKKYYKKFDEIEAYEQVVKDKVLSDIKSNPFWYVKILLLRINAVLSKNIPFNCIGYLLIPIFLLLIKWRDYKTLIVFIASLPLSATSILIYSGKGNTYNSIYTYFVLCFLLALFIEYICRHKNNSLNAT